jgi:hypothetical protein
MLPSGSGFGVLVVHESSGPVVESRARGAEPKAVRSLRPAGLILRVLLGLVVVTAALELSTRALGAVDFPLYELDPDVEYLLRPNQAGVFLNRNAWAANDRGMPTDRRWADRREPSLLVIGNSIVAGGNPYDQTEKVAAVLGRLLGDRFAVWPIAAGGWSTVNEIAYLERHADVTAGADFFIWSHVQGGLVAANTWLGERVFPTRRPSWATGYVFDRYVAPRVAAMAGIPRVDPWVFDAASAAKRQREDLAANLHRFDAMLGTLARSSGRPTPGALLLYPTRTQLIAAGRGEEWLPERADLERLAAAHDVSVIDLVRYPQWTAQLYRDDVHPTVEGNQVLARILASVVDRALEP